MLPSPPGPGAPRSPLPAGQARGAGAPGTSAPAALCPPGQTRTGGEIIVADVLCAPPLSSAVMPRGALYSPEVGTVLTFILQTREPRSRGAERLTRALSQSAEGRGVDTKSM